ncbi:MAG: CbiX/SirB N-terminal domain-containing protein [Gammaproteobacteria bacterium]|nr:CbiX/SirB N-terminal domain-containing protein [Gammaproteobacteria bacterium]
MPHVDAVILLAHGSRDPHWIATFEQLAAPTLGLDIPAFVAYMELARPTLEEAIETAVAKGAQRVRIVPLFLAAGKHLREDVPAMLKDLQPHYSVPLELLAPVGEHPALAVAIKDIVLASLSGETPAR